MVGELFQKYWYLSGRIDQKAVATSALYRFKVSALLRNSNMAAESNSNLAPVNLAKSSFVLNLVITRSTGVWRPLRSIRTIVTRLAPFLISYLPGLMFSQ